MRKAYGVLVSNKESAHKKRHPASLVASSNAFIVDH